MDQLLQVQRNPDYARELKYRTLAYFYSVSATAHGDPFLYWHWNPSDTKWPYPHMHASIVGDPGGRGSRLHIPTGQRVTIEQVIGFLIRENLATPALDDWEAVLADGQRRFDAYKSQ